MSQRVTHRITRMWGHRKNVPNRDNPGQINSVEVLEVKITKKNLAYLKEAVRLAEERLATLGKHFGEEALEDQDRRMSERKNKLSKLTKRLSLTRCQSYNFGQVVMTAEGFEPTLMLSNLPPVQEKEAEEACLTKTLMKETGGFEGLRLFVTATKVIKTDVSEGSICFLNNPLFYGSRLAPRTCHFDG